MDWFKSFFTNTHNNPHQQASSQNSFRFSSVRTVCMSDPDDRQSLLCKQIETFWENDKDGTPRQKTLTKQYKQPKNHNHQLPPNQQMDVFSTPFDNILSFGLFPFGRDDMKDMMSQMQRNFSHMFNPRTGNFPTHNTQMPKHRSSEESNNKYPEEYYFDKKSTGSSTIYDM